MVARYVWIFQLRSEHTRQHRASTLVARQSEYSPDIKLD